MDHQPDHPVRRLIDNNNNNIAILSPLVQLSFVFHLAIAHLQQHSHNHPHSLVTVIIGSSTQASFQKALVDENDAFLMKASSDNSALSHLLERIEFRLTGSEPESTDSINIYGLDELLDLHDFSIPNESVQAQAKPIRSHSVAWIYQFCQLQLASFCPQSSAAYLPSGSHPTYPKMAVLCYAFFLDLERSIRGSSSSSEKPT
ncbi:hypothetical protein PSTT_07879 [Puccinia striiformis]|uniref:Uncharacterized protein n=1 Tax=Puccinia striiformis TaxID=27350 RepID=A0A2S4VEX9_9BASI|nr:hypothetical protein PSTT_07879 [Puccinia striiformis]